MTIIECVLALMVLTVVVRIVWGTDEGQSGERLAYLGVLFFALYLPGCTPTKPVAVPAAMWSGNCPANTYLLGNGHCSEPIAASGTAVMPNRTGFPVPTIGKQATPVDTSDVVFDKAMSDLRDSSARLGVALRERDESFDQLDVALGQLHDAAVQLNEELTKLQHELDAPAKDWPSTLAPNIIRTCLINGLSHPASDCLAVGPLVPSIDVPAGSSGLSTPTVTRILPETCEEMVARVSRESHITPSVNCLKDAPK